MALERWLSELNQDYKAKYTASSYAGMTVFFDTSVKENIIKMNFTFFYFLME
jgi:hypothetical protein